MLDGRPRWGPWAPLTPAEANIELWDGGYGLTVRRGPSGELRLGGPGTGQGIPLGNDPTWAQLYRTLVRLRRTRQVADPARLERLTRSLEGESGKRAPFPGLPVDGETLTSDFEIPDVAQRVLRRLRDDRPPGSDEDTGVRLYRTDPDSARRAVSGCDRLAQTLASDAVFRMYCAYRPTPVGWLGSRNAEVLHVVEPAPAHPAHPGGTVAVRVDALRRGLLHLVIANRYERGEDELGYFLEHFIRPLVRAFRCALDTHRLSIGGFDQHTVGFELSCELQATGRVVITDHAGTSAAVADAVCESGRALLASIDALSAAFRNPSLGDREMRPAVERVIGEELRDLRPDTIDLLPEQLRPYAHAVAPAQDAVLRKVLHTVQERTRIRRHDQRVPRPAVVIDLDLCGIVPLERTLAASKAIAGPRPGAPDGIPELAHPEGLAVLPTYADSTWHTFLDANGLPARYPEVDWWAVHEEFFHAFARPWDRLRTDAVNAGLARFVWDVQDAGGLVVFCTGRRERVRAHTEAVLAAGGVPDAVVVCMPDERTRPISELKVERLRQLGELDVVAIFDDLLANRIALAKEFPGARPIAVEIPGMAAERQPEQSVADRVSVISTFETMPRAGAGNVSNTHSLEELQLGALRQNRVARRWAVRLTEEESQHVVDSILSDVDASALRTAQRARVNAGLDHASEHEDGVIRALHHVFTRKQFRKGSRANYECEDMRRDALPFIRDRQPIEVVLLGFPVKQCLNQLKASGPLPDLAELGGLARLRELARAVTAIYPPGLHITVLTDGRHFRQRPRALTEAYTRKLREYRDLLGITGYVTFEEIDQLAERRLGAELRGERTRRIAHYRAQLERLLRDFDITNNPLRTLAHVDQYPSLRECPPYGLFRDMLMSLVYSVPVAFPPGVDQAYWARLVFSGLYHPHDRSVSADVRRARLAILRRAWHMVIRYLATLRADEELGYEELFPHRVRLTVSAARPGRCGFTYLGGSGLLPWQGTGAVERRGHLAVDFAVAMGDQGFVPVYSPILGPRQPWMMVPAQYTRPDRDRVRVDAEVLHQIRLRRK